MSLKLLDMRLFPIFHISSCVIDTCVKLDVYIEKLNINKQSITRPRKSLQSGSHSTGPEGKQNPFAITNGSAPNAGTINIFLFLHPFLR